MVEPIHVPSDPGRRALPPPPPPAVLVPARTPRAGELTPGWRIVVALAWVATALALAAVWNTSRQLGLSTWWLGARARPRPRVVQLTPFVAPLLMVLATVNHVRWLGWLGVVAAAVTAGFGIGDIGRVPGLALAELLIAAAAGAVSVASLTGTYRGRRRGEADPGRAR